MFIGHSIYMLQNMNCQNNINVSANEFSKTRHNKIKGNEDNDE